jgi:hypothetical protein
MAFRAYQQDEPNWDFDGRDLDGHTVAESCVPVEFFAGESVCQSAPIRRRRPMLRNLVVIGLLIAGGYGWMNAPQDLKDDAISASMSAMGTIRDAALERMRASPPSHTLAEPQPVAPPPPLTETREIATSAADTVGEPVAVPPPETAPAAAEESEAPVEEAAVPEEDPEPLPPPKVDSADPYQKRAVEAGLNPGLSRTLLSRLSDTDYKNATIAIKRALAETPENRIFSWPKEGAGGKLALFEVSFVRSAGPDCRRYVVVVTKNRWSTTALPMERCGLKVPAGIRKAAG